MADVFLSYARPSVKAARRVAEALRASGYTVWFDENLPAHRDYSDVIEEQLEDASAVVVLWSSDAVRSQWVRSEANRARETGRLVQLRLDDARLPMPFDQIQCPDLTRWRGNLNSAAWLKVIASVAALLGGGSVAAAVTRGQSEDRISRRRMLIGGAAVATVAAGSFAWWRGSGPDQPNPEARLLFEKGTNALQSNDAFDPDDPAAAAQAVAILTNATRLDPNYAPAWGALAMAYAARKSLAPPSQRSGFDSRGRSAAMRALALDPKEGRALGALRIMDPVYRNWLAAERANREALKVQPRLPFLLFLLANVLGSVGRWREAAGLSQKFDRKRFLIAGADRQVLVNLWAAGDLSGADDAMRLAVENWPQHPPIWRTRIAYLMYSGRPTEALQLLRDPAERPPEIPEEMVRAAEATALALAGRGGRDDAVSRNLALLDAQPAAVFAAAHACTALGDTKSALALLHGYYFDEGEWARLAPAGGDFDRQTSPLFQPPMRDLWHDEAFAELLRRIGLEEYWRRSGTLPDFRGPARMG